MGYVLKSAPSCKLKPLELQCVISHCAGCTWIIFTQRVRKIVMGVFEVSELQFTLITVTKKKNFVTLSLCPDQRGTPPLAVCNHRTDLMYMYMSCTFPGSFSLGEPCPYTTTMFTGLEKEDTLYLSSRHKSLARSTHLPLEINSHITTTRATTSLPRVLLINKTSVCV